VYSSLQGNKKKNDPGIILPTNLESTPQTQLPRFQILLHLLV